MNERYPLAPIDDALAFADMNGVVFSSEYYCRIDKDLDDDAGQGVVCYACGLGIRLLADGSLALGDQVPGDGRLVARLLGLPLPLVLAYSDGFAVKPPGSTGPINLYQFEAGEEDLAEFYVLGLDDALICGIAPSSEDVSECRRTYADPAAWKEFA